MRARVMGEILKREIQRMQGLPVNQHPSRRGRSPAQPAARLGGRGAVVQPGSSIARGPSEGPGVLAGAVTGEVIPHVVGVFGGLDIQF